jgi:hypothetical protein
MKARRRASRARPNTVEVRLADALEKTIQRWVAWSGRKVPIPEASWLEGPIGDAYVGASFYRGYARENGLEAVADEKVGLLPDFGALAGERFDPSLVHPRIRDFYERTARHDLDVGIDWSGPFRHPPRTLIYLVGRNVGQFDIPLSSSNVRMENELVGFEDPSTGVRPSVGCLRRSAAHGSFALVADGRRFGEAGYYRIHRTGGTLRVKQVPIREVLHVSPGPDGTLLARHEFAFCGVRFLTLRYAIFRHG